MLLLDEPLGALDLKLRREMQIELQELQRDVGITFVFVTHDQEEALTMSDRIAVFNDGPHRAGRHAGRALRVAGLVVRGRLRRHLQPADRRAARRVVGRDGSFSIRPEKIQLVGAGELHATSARQGTVEAVVYLGSVNHYVVELDGGGTLTVLRQNLHGTSDQALDRGDRVGLGWADEHVIDLTRTTTASGHPPGGTVMRNIRTLASTAALGLALATALAACGTDAAATTAAAQAAEEQGGFTPPDLPMAETLGDNEGALSVLAWPGYAEDGSTDKAVDWVTPFEKETGCEVT